MEYIKKSTEGGIRMEIYDFVVKDAKLQDVPLSDYKGKVLLIVNTATGCGYTPQYAGLEALYEKYAGQGFEILDFPCNQFLGQAPGTNAEIVGFCQKNYGVKFKTFSKIKVNGKETEPLYSYLKDAVKDDSKKETPVKFMDKIRTFGRSENDIKWNFTKFLVDREGHVTARFEPAVTPGEIDAPVAALLSK
jgi:glutathione peroxidase